MREYANRIQSLPNPTFQQIRRISNEALSHFSKSERDTFWQNLNQGVDLLDSHELMCQYIFSYGNMHEAKIQKALSSIHNPRKVFNTDIAIVDWGCGQGLATVCFFDFLKSQEIPNNTQKLILIEPSEQALERAKLHTNVYLNDETKIQLVNKYLDDVKKIDIETNQSITVHFFSNILDVPQIDLKKLAQLVGENVSGEHYIFCVSPLIEGRSHRLDAFYNYFDLPPVFSDFEQSENKLNLLAEDTHLKDVARKYTLKLKVFKFERNTTYYIPIDYYPAVQFHAGYYLDCLKNQRDELSLLSDFEVSAPFDIGASVYKDVHPIFAVLNNIITRGLPTKASPFIETTFASFGNSPQQNDFGSIIFENKNVDPNNLQLTQSPIAIARLQKTIIEAILTEQLDIQQNQWSVLVKENDVPCAAIAFEDLRQMFESLTSLSLDFDTMKFPKVNLEIICSQEYLYSPLHLETRPVSNSTNQQKSKVYDLVIVISMDKLKDNNEASFSEFKCKNHCYFNIRSVKFKKSKRHIYTSDNIDYKPLVIKNSHGNHIDIEENKKKLQYFAQLLFRKENFRPGQLPILHRALQNKSIIGLLPTGGGKSLTYQLAAMLQPGVTLIIDPLRSLMKDQYDGLINVGIDTCAFINSSLSSTEKNDREKQMETSQLQFVFLSPERLCIFKFRERLKSMRDMNVYFAYGVIDEVHCVSEWGHDFRFSYLHLGRNLFNYVLPKNKNKRLTLFGLTATASFDVLADVERELSGNGAFQLDSDTIVRYENTNRLELQYRVEKTTPLTPPTSKWDIYKAKNLQVANYISKIPNLVSELQDLKAIENIKMRFIEREGLTESTDKYKIQEILSAKLNINFNENWLDSGKPYENGGIVFCPHRQGSLGVLDTMTNRGVESAITNDLPCKDVGTFLGGDEMIDQDKFIGSDLAIMVATKAFGMGIDKSNVRFTINVNHSSSLESFVQEAGRAGRDKKMALATILYSEYLDFDKEVVMYFHNNTFKGATHEKQVMNDLLSIKDINFFIAEDETIEELDTVGVSGFLNTLLNSEPNQNIVSFLSYIDKGNFNPVIHNTRKYEEYEGVDKYDYVAKAIYRMTCIGVVDDFTQDYSNHRFRIVTKRKADGDYCKCLKEFLMRYYSVERAEEEIQKVSLLKGNNEIHKCLGYLTEFIYDKIEVKRKRAIDDIRNFCVQGINDSKSWLETNEELKDFIYYYFNSKYAKVDYETENGEPFSLTSDTDFGKESSIEILMKYLRVVDDDVYGSSGSPKDSIKHLQGAVRLIRRSLTDKNPSLSMLNAFCIVYLGTNNNEVLEQELENSYKEGYRDFYFSSTDKELFYQNIETFKRKLKLNNISNKVLKGMHNWETECELDIHQSWLNNFTKSYTQS
jgi:superfamily II DNA helicase RecQ